MGRVLGTVGKVAGVVGALAFAAGTLGVGSVATAALLTQIGTVASIASPPAAVGATIGRPPMTAINLVADHRRAYLATDSGYFDPASGRIVALHSKVVSLPSAHMAIGFSGATTPEHLTQHLAAHCDKGTQRGILRTLPEVVAAMAGEMREANPTGHKAGWNTVRLWIATYDRVLAKPRLFTIASDPDPSMPDKPPLEVRETSGWTTGLTQAQIRAVLPSGYVADPRRDLARIFQAQRGYANPLSGGGCGVAGDCDLYTVSRRGVEVETLITFPEQVGDLPDGGNSTAGGSERR